MKAHPSMTGEGGEILRAVAAERGLSVKELLGPGQQHYVAHPRQEAMWRLYKTERYSLPGIGRLLGGRDHTTVLWGIRQHEKRMAEQ